MPEPRSPRVRPIHVARWSRLLRWSIPLVAMVLLAGCGDAGTRADSGGGSGAPEPGRAARTVAGCDADTTAVRGARDVAEADLDGDGSAERVRLTGTTPDCPNTLFAEVEEGYVWGRMPDAGPRVRSAYGVRLGEGGDLLVTRQEHPRGGFQLRVFARAEERLVQLERESGESLVPFVATDVLEHPLSVDCEQGELVLTEAVAHEPPGVLFTWDIRRTTYAVSGGTVTERGSEEVADNVPSGRIGKDHPELARHAMFESCRRG